MSALYFDTSAIVPAFVREPASDSINSLIAVRGTQGLVISTWGLTEFSSAVTLKLRMGAISAELHASVLEMWSDFVAGVRVLQVEERDFHAAAGLCQRPDLALRAGDALHLALAQRGGCELATSDRRMREGALAVGLALASF